MPSNDFYDWLFKGFITVFVMVSGYLFVYVMKLIKEAADKAQLAKDDLAEHKLYISEHYAKKDDLTPIYKVLDEMRTDIKTLLSRKD